MMCDKCKLSTNVKLGQILLFPKKLEEMNEEVENEDCD